MRQALVLTFGLALAGGAGASDAWAQEPAPAAPAAAAAAEPAGPALLTDEELDALVARVALYPDPLLALVLQAATLPIEVVQATRFLEKHAADPKLEPDPNWDSSITGLLNYPTALRLMNDDLDWTQELGDAVVNQLGDVQAAVQQVRAEFQAAGALESNDKQVVVTTGDTIKIEPANPQVIYVPVYQPVAVEAAPLQVTPEPAAAGSAPPASYAPAPATGYPQQPGYYPPPAYYPPPPTYAAPAVTYSDPYPSFWTNAASFAGGAVLGGLLGYALGDDNNNNNNNGGHYEIDVNHNGNWNGNNGNWNGNGGGGSRNGNNVNIEGNNVVVAGNGNGRNTARSNQLTQNELKNRQASVTQLQKSSSAANVRAQLQAQPTAGARATTRPAAGTTTASRQTADNAAAARQSVGTTGATRPNQAATSANRQAAAAPTATRPATAAKRPSAVTSQPARVGDRPASGKGGGAFSSVESQRQVAREADRGQRSRATATQARPAGGQSVQQRAAPTQQSGGRSSAFAPSRGDSGRASARGQRSRDGGGGRGR